MSEVEETDSPPVKMPKLEDGSGNAEIPEIEQDFTEDTIESNDKFTIYDKYNNFVTPEELEKLKEFQIIDEVNSDDEDSNDDDSDSSEGKEEEDMDLPDEEIEKMLDENLPEELKAPPKPKEKPYVTRTKIVLEEKGINQFEVLPLDWMLVRHYSGMPIYMHRPTRVCTLAKPYFLGKGNTRRHDIPISAIPCLAYRRALKEEEKEKEIDRRVEEQIKNKTWLQANNSSQNKENTADSDANKTDQGILQIKTDNDCDKDDELKNNSTQTVNRNTKCPFNRSNGTDIERIENQEQSAEQRTILNNPDIMPNFQNIKEEFENKNDKESSEGANEATCSSAYNLQIRKKGTEGWNEPGCSNTGDILLQKAGTKRRHGSECSSPGSISHKRQGIEGWNVPRCSKTDNIQAGGQGSSVTSEPGCSTTGNIPSAMDDIEDWNKPGCSYADSNIRSTRTEDMNEPGCSTAGGIPAEMPGNGARNEPESAPDTSRCPVVLPGGLVVPSPRVESVDTSWKTQHLTAEQINDYCKNLFKFKTVNFMHFNRWADRRKYTKARKALQYPKLPQGTKLITIPSINNGQENGGKATKRDWVMNMNGGSYLSEFHEYVCRALHKQPVYEYKQLENAATPYQATVVIGGMAYGVGRGSSKRQAKYAAARASIQTLIPAMRDALEPGQARRLAEPDFTTSDPFFDYIGIEDPRIADFCASTCEPSPHAILLTCLLRNFGIGEWHVKVETKKLEYQKMELTMRVGKHSATVVCKNKKTAKQRAAQAILQALHPHINSWGSLLRLYGSRSVKSCKEKKLEEQQITLLQDKARHNEPNYAVLEKLRSEMRKLQERDSAVVPIGTLLLAEDLPEHSASNLNNVDL